MFASTTHTGALATSQSFKMSLLKNIIVVGDRVLIEPDPGQTQTESGLYLPPSVKEKEEVRSGKVIKVGPGYPLPPNHDFDEFLKDHKEPSAQYIPLQMKEGDQVLFLSRAAHDISYDGKDYVIVSQASILMIVRDELAALDIH